MDDDREGEIGERRRRSIQVQITVIAKVEQVQRPEAVSCIGADGEFIWCTHWEQGKDRLDELAMSFVCGAELYSKREHP